MAKFLMEPLIGTEAKTARLGAGTGSSNWLNDNDAGKCVKLVGDSRFDLCAAGDAIEGFITTVDTASADGYSTGGVRGDKRGDRVLITFDGLQATPGTGAVAVGDYVVTGTVVAKNTAISGTFPAPKVTKATDQAAAKASPFAWRVVSLGSAGTGAVGTTGTIERV